MKPKPIVVTVFDVEWIVKRQSDCWLVLRRVARGWRGTRERMGLTQVQMARHLKMPQSTYSKMETGVLKPSPRVRAVLGKREAQAGGA